MTKRLLLLVCMLTGIFSVADAQHDGTIKGRVTTSGRKPAQDVTVVLEGTKRTAATNESGEFIFYNVKPGTYSLSISLLGYEKTRKDVDVQPGAVKDVAFMLSVSENQLNEVTVKSRNNKFARKQSQYVARMPLENLENAQVYSVIPKELMAEQMVTDYRNAIRNVAGTNTLEQVWNGRTSTFIRGFRTGSYVRNGLNTTQLISVDPVNLESIEVLKGPSGTLFGTGTVSYGGAVNRVTKKPLNYQSTELSLTGGSFGLSRLTVDLNTPLDSAKKALLRINAARHSQESFQTTGYMRNYTLAPSFSYQVNDKLSMMVEMELIHSTTSGLGAGITPNLEVSPGLKSFKDLEKHYNQTYLSNDLNGKYPAYNLFGQVKYQFNDKWSSTTLYTMAGVDARDQYTVNPSFITADSIARTAQKYSHQYYNVQLQQNFNGEFLLGGMRHRVLFGIDYTSSVTKPTYNIVKAYDKFNYNNGVPYVTRNQIEQFIAAQGAATAAYTNKSNNYGLYASDVINLTDKFIAMLALRFDGVDNKGTTQLRTGVTTGKFDKTAFSPKLGLVYQLIQDQLSVFGNYMNGFNYSSTLDASGKVFKPEQANQLEGGLKADLFNRRFSATFSYYDISVKDKLRQDPANTAFYLQDGTQESKGFEIEAIVNPLPGLNIIAGYAYNDSKFTKASPAIEGKTAPQAPKNFINTWISYKFQNSLKGLGLGIGGNYQGESFYNDVNTFVIPEFTVINSTVFYDYRKFRLGVKADNLTDEKYWGPWGNPQPPRNYAASISVKF